MRLWSIHPKYLVRQGLTALWREGLLCQAVLGDRTKGYRNHPQLSRFKAQNDPMAAIGAYLGAVVSEAEERGYAFDRRKIDVESPHQPIEVTTGQIAFEWAHLLKKLELRSPLIFEKWASLQVLECHPLFRIHPGPIENWERA